MEECLKVNLLKIKTDVCKKVRNWHPSWSLQNGGGGMQPLVFQNPFWAALLFNPFVLELESASVLPGVPDGFHVLLLPLLLSSFVGREEHDVPSPVLFPCNPLCALIGE